MAVFRRSGGIVAFYWQGKLPDPRTEAFSDALAQRRFRTIEDAASEEVSIGWVTPLDPTGDSFAPQDLEAGTGTWLRLRIDKKVLPKKWLLIHRDAAEKAKGRKLSARERRELKDDLADKLLPRVLPTINLVDALLFHERSLVLLFGSSRNLCETFAKLFFETFTIPLDRGGPFQCALHAGLDPTLVRRLDELEPVRWPRATDDERGPAPRSSSGAARADTTEDADEALA